MSSRTVTSCDECQKEIPQSRAQSRESREGNSGLVVQIFNYNTGPNTGLVNDRPSSQVLLLCDYICLMNWAATKVGAGFKKRES